MKIKELLRTEQWWGHILPPIMLFYYLGLLRSNAINKHIYYHLFFLILISVLTGFAGYFINDLSDMEEDRKAEKKNMVSRLPLFLKIVFLPIVFLLVFICCFIILSFISEWASLFYCTIFIVNILLFTLYSTPPVRFKKSLYLAPVFDALYSGTFFYLLSYGIAVYGTTYTTASITDIPYKIHPSVVIILCLFFWGFLKGLRNFLNHLCNDRKHDELSGLKTLATHYGSKKIQLTANLLYPFELFFLILFFLQQQDFPYVPILMCFLFFLLWLKNILNNASLKYIQLNDLHEVWLPMIILIQFIISKNSFWPLLIIHFVLFPYHVKKIHHVLDFIYFHTFFKLIGPIRKSK